MVKKRQDDALIQRAALGMWRHPESREYYKFSVYEYSENLMDTYFTVNYQSGKSYVPERSYTVTSRQMNDLLEKIKRYGFVQTELTYPQLQEFFIDGKPATEGAIFMRDLNTAFAESKIKPEYRTGLEVLMASLD